MNELNRTKEISIFNRSTLMGGEIGVYGTAEEPLFKAKDVAERIEHSDVSMMLKGLGRKGMEVYDDIQ